MAGLIAWGGSVSVLMAEDLWRGAAEPPLAAIEAAELQQYIRFLADDSLEGREAGSRGGRAAGNFLIERCQAWDLTPAGERGGFVQEFRGGYRNILAVIEGSHPKLKEEYILLGAHYDHVGYGKPSNSYGPLGRIHNGADDNASGTAALLEIAEALRHVEQRPARSVVIAFWDGEEQGLLGSQHWVREPTLELSQIRLMVNIDMIGRLRPQGLEVYGTRTAGGLRHLVSSSNEAGLKLSFNWDLREDSDHYPFARREIPILMYHTGLHGEYHRPSDDPHTINQEGLAAVTKLTLETIWRAANADRLPGFRAAAWNESEFARKQFERLPAEPAADRLGLTLIVPETDPTPALDGEGRRVGLMIRLVDRGGPAREAGIEPGDRLISLNGMPIDSIGQYQSLLVRAPAESRLRILTLEEELVDLEVTLRGKPTRVGLSWIPDAADPSQVLVTKIVPHSPAAEAGLHPGDRIYEVNGQNFSGSKGLLRLFEGATGETRCTVERAGTLHELQIGLPPE